MDRAPGFEPGGWGFESLRVRQVYGQAMNLNDFTDRHLRTARAAYEAVHTGAKFQDLSDDEKRQWRTMAKVTRFIVIGELLTDGGYVDIFAPEEGPPRCPKCQGFAPLGGDLCPHCDALIPFEGPV